MRRALSIKYKLILGGILAVLIPFVIAAIIIYIQLSQSLLDITKQKSVHMAEEISAGIDSLLKQELELASAIAADLDVVASSRTGDYQATQAELEAIHHRLNRSFFTIFVTDKHGIARAEAFFTHQIGLDLSDRDYFKNAQKGKTSISGPLYPLGRMTPGVPIIVVCAPIMDKNEFLGAVALAFDTEFLREVLSQKKAGQTGYAFLMNKDGLILVHPQKKYMMKYRLLDQPGTENIKALLDGHQAGTAEYNVGNIEKVIGLARGKRMDWVAALVQDQDEILQPVHSILWSICASAAVFLLVTILAIIYFSSKISHPIHRSLEMIKQVTRHSNEIIIQAGADGKIVFVNPAFEKVTGFKSRDIMGLGMDINTTLNFSKKKVWQSLQRGVPWSGRASIKGAGANDIILDVTILPLRNDRGVIGGYLEIGRDITSEMMFEKRLQQAQKMEAIGTLAGGIAHDFNNILAGIFGYAELCLIKKDSPDLTDQYIREIIVASERARDLVSQILTFSRQTDVTPEVLLPKSVLKEVLKLLRASIPARIAIQTKIESNCAIMADPTQIHQIVMNLVTNGVHAIGNDKGVIKLELEDFMVDDAFTQTHPNISAGKHVIISVSDSGSGMDPDTLEHVFEPFFTTKPKGKGTGMGLSMVHGIVKRLNGIVTVYSELGHGSKFNVILPCVQANESKLVTPVSYIREGTERILVVDDEKAISVSMETILSSLGYRVTAFTDSRQALAALLADPPAFDILITDYSMPHLNGLEIIREMKAAGIDLPVILSSGFLGKTLEEEAEILGVSLMITKPITTYQLTSAIQKALSQK